jgi:pimeloyl-ACP methyl ester carboxylesterase
VTEKSPQPLSWTIDGLRVAGLAWGDSDQPPLLALHGWLDNANSFAVLAPLLCGRQVVALDLTGHGHSDKRSADATYNIWDDLPQILGVVDKLGWNEFDLLGHSRGGIIATLFAAAQPQRIRTLTLLDALMPEPMAPEAVPAQLARFLSERLPLMQREPRRFADLAEAAAARTGKGLHEEAARLLTERSVRQTDGGVEWTGDARLRGASAMKLTAGQIQAVLAAITAPVLLLMAQDGHARHPELTSWASASIARLESETMGGGHHFHMEENAPLLARRILQFLENYD